MSMTNRIGTYLKKGCRSIFFRVFIIIGIIGAMSFAALAGADKPNWVPIPPEEFALKDCPGMPGASAVYLYREIFYDMANLSAFVHKRIKILTPEGRKYADAEIHYIKDSLEIKNLFIRSFTPDGKEIPFKGEIFEKKVVGVNNMEMIAKTFTFPNVEVGTIIEYCYSVKTDLDNFSTAGLTILSSLGSSDISEDGISAPYEGGFDSEEMNASPVYSWILQDSLYTMKARFRFLPIAPSALKDMIGKSMRLIWIFQKLSGIQPFINAQKEIELEMTSIPPFEKEELMSPPSGERMAVVFFYFNDEFKTLDDFWTKEVEAWRKGLKKFMEKDQDKIQSMATGLTQNTTDPVEKLNKLYEWAQQIKNLSYIPDLSVDQWKEKKFKENKKVSDVLERKYGCRSDITRTFVALARAAKFDAQVARVTTRIDKSFRKNYPVFYGQFDSEIAVVMLNGKEMYLDPATPFCPFGWTEWSKTFTVGVREIKNGPDFFSILTSNTDISKSRIEVDVSIDDLGDLNGTAKVLLNGHDALDWKLRAITSDQAELKKDWEDYFRRGFPSGSKVTFKTIEGLKDNKPGLTVNFDIQVAGMGINAGSKTTLQVLSLGTTKMDLFSHPRRVFPIDFQFPQEILTDIKVVFPDKIQLSTPPKTNEINTDFAHFSIRTGIENEKTLRVQKEFKLTRHYFEPVLYSKLKTFVTQMETSEEEPVIISR